MTPPAAFYIQFGSPKWSTASISGLVLLHPEFTAFTRCCIVGDVVGGKGRLFLHKLTADATSQACLCSIAILLESIQIFSFFSSDIIQFRHAILPPRIRIPLIAFVFHM